MPARPMYVSGLTKKQKSRIKFVRVLGLFTFLGFGIAIMGIKGDIVIGVSVIIIGILLYFASRIAQKQGYY